MRARRPEEEPYREPRPAEEAAATELAALSGLSNAGIGRMLARSELSPAGGPLVLDPGIVPPGPGVEPHEASQDADTPKVLEEAKAAKGEGEDLDGTIELEPGEETAAPENVNAAPADKAPAAVTAPDHDAVAQWLDRPVTTNREYAQWILDGGGHGFVSFGYNSRQQLRTYAAGRAHAMTGTTHTSKGDVTEAGGAIDGGSRTLLPVLETTKGVVGGRARRWLEDDSKPKQPLTLLWLARNWPGGDAHSTARSLDASGGGIDFTSADAAGKVVQIMEDLPAGDYWIGLPWQGPFFDPNDSLLHFTRAAERAARASRSRPADVTEPALVEWQLDHYTATWRGGWVQTAVAGTPATDKLRDAALRSAFAGGDGKTFAAFPDRPDHIHIQRV